MNSYTSSSDVMPVSTGKRFVAVTAGLVVTIALVFCAASEWLIRTHVAPNQNIELHAEFLRGSSHPNAAFGDSHVAMGITGSEEIINLGFPANTLNDIIGKARIYFGRVPPGNVILQADPQQLVPGRLNQSFEPDRPLFEGDGGLFRFLKLSVPVYRRGILGHWESFLAGRPFTKLRQFNPEDGSQTATRNIADWTEEQVVELSETILTDQQDLAVDLSHPVLTRYLDLAKWIVAQGGQVCFASYPVDRTFYRMAAPDPTEQRSIDLFTHMADEVGGRFVDFRTRDYPRELFFDPDHLTEEGGKVFTQAVLQACFD